MAEMATRFNFSTRDLFWAITLAAVVLGFYVRDVQRQKQAQAEIDATKREWIKDRNDLRTSYRREHLTLRQDIQQLRQRLGE